MAKLVLAGRRRGAGPGGDLRPRSNQLNLLHLGLVVALLAAGLAAGHWVGERLGLADELPAPDLTGSFHTARRSHRDEGAL